jgi:hypothetical protein
LGATDEFRCSGAACVRITIKPSISVSPPIMELLADATLDTTSYAVGWGTLALLNAGLAQSKNHSGLLWFLLSLLLGPIATFLIVVFCGKLPDRL